MRRNKIIIGVIIACICLLLLIETRAQQQNPQLAKIKSEMQNLSFWAGHWQGESVAQMGPGQSSKSIVNEYIQFKLDSTVLLIEGIGTLPAEIDANQSKVHHALAILSYNAEKNQFEFKSHLYDGRSTEAWFKHLGENKFLWGFDTPQGKIRYHLLLDPKDKTWKETGEFSRDGNQWMQFMEMNLTKVTQ